MITGRRSSPASVSLYSTMPGWPVGTVAITPASSSSLRRFDSSDGDISGTPRRRSLKRVVPHSSSRKTRAVQREHTTSAPMATGQNWP